MPKTTGEIGKTILVVLGAIGLVTVAVTAPNLLQVFGNRGRYKNCQYQRSLNTLKKKKLVTIRQSKQRLQIKLTNEGYKQLNYVDLFNIEIKREQKWDKKWRLVMFDIPVTYNKARIELTHLLKRLGFKMLQKSVWICPWPCSTEIECITSAYRINRFVKVITAEEIPQSQELSEYFQLT